MFKTVTALLFLLTSAGFASAGVTCKAGIESQGAIYDAFPQTLKDKNCSTPGCFTLNCRGLATFYDCDEPSVCDELEQQTCHGIGKEGTCQKCIGNNCNAPKEGGDPSPEEMCEGACNKSSSISQFTAAVIFIAMAALFK